MRYVGNNQYEIENTRTGEKRIVGKNELSTYGLGGGGNILTDIASSLASPFVGTGRNIVGAVAQTPMMLASGKLGEYATDSANPEILRKIARSGSDAYGGAAKGIGDMGLGLNEGQFKDVSDRPGQEIIKQLGRSGEIASYGIPIGKGWNALKGGAVLGGAYSAGKQMEETGELPDVGKTLLDAGLGAATAGTFALGGKTIGKLRGSGDKITKAGVKISEGARQIKQPSSVYGAGKEKAINTTLNKYGFKGPPQKQYEMLEPTLQKIESKIDDIVASNPNASISKEELKKSFLSNLKSQLRTKDITNKQAQSEVASYLDDILKASGGTGKFQNISLKSLRSLKRLVNEDYGPVKAILDRNGTLSPRQHVVNVAWKSIDDAVRETSPGLKQLLVDQSNIFRAASSLGGARFNPPTFRIAGTSVPASVSKGLEDMAGRKMQETGGILNKITESIPQGGPTGDVLTKGSIMSMLSGRGKPQGQNADQYSQNYSGQDDATSDLQHTDSISQGEPILSPQGQWKWDEESQDWIPNTDSGNQSNIPTKEQFKMAMVNDLQTTGGENVAQLKAAYQTVYPEVTSSANTNKRKTILNQSVPVLDRVIRSALEAPPGFRGQFMSEIGKIPGVSGGPAEYLRRDTEGFARLIASAFATEVGVATDKDVQRWLNIMPREGDAMEERKRQSQQLISQLIAESELLGIDIPPKVIELAQLLDMPEYGQQQ